ncbi:baseplate assembly protein [Dyella sp. M7H15-1]|uniref:GPW/gp25 family protein n=1 Tax=Dyella sp. M7H15-1 TaxID=2501295 RepID=UPI001004E97E|nr:GPW/gp25 family protein [Dyella sp. M7H15-1]QAU25012.1 baseplate assembly protein [Dyella sp. M7H15-1]
MNAIRNKGDDFLGRGWAFPVRVQGGSICFAVDEDDIRQAIVLILQTAPGERVLLPDFGCRINELVFAAGNAASLSLAQLYVQDALEQWEPRIQLVGVTASIDLDQPQRMIISVDYVIRDKNRPDNLVYPFYLKS